MKKTTLVAIISAFIAGLIFSLGLLLSGMANPEKVLAFLDLAGAWDPSLALVMAGAIAVALPAFHFARKRSRCLLGGEIQLPTKRKLDRRLITGSLAFGIGWGLAGFCPGPALVATGALLPQATTFVLAMLAGMLIFRLLEKKYPAHN
jgi:uncharacterized protein